MNARALPALSLRGVTVALGGRVVVERASLDVPRGTATVVVGRSGAGKSVLWKAAAGLLPRAAGDVVVHAPPLVFVHQDPALLDDRTVLDNVLLPATARRVAPRSVLVDEATQLLRRLGLLDQRALRPTRLSPSSQRRTALARALLLRPGVLIVDEPTTGLDPDSAADVDDALVALVDDHRAVVVITHHPRTLARLRALPGAVVVVVDSGRVVDESSPRGEAAPAAGATP
jgi:ABC-type transporter Mla maintaining outer membrane lipid asymmetry ATPase subunit MlaF